MIKINLLNGERKLAKKAFVLGGPLMTTVGCGAILVVALLACGWRFLSVMPANSQLDADLAPPQQAAAAGRPHRTAPRRADRAGAHARPDQPGAAADGLAHGNQAGARLER